METINRKRALYKKLFGVPINSYIEALNRQALGGEFSGSRNLAVAIRLGFPRQ